MSEAPELIDQLLKRLRPEEGGFYPRVYRDSKGIPTVGYGFNLNRPDTSSRLASVGLLRSALMSGMVQMTEEQGEKLLDFDAVAAFTDAADIAGHEAWARLPDTARVIIADMCFNMGPGTLAMFHKMLAAIRQNPPDFVTAEREMEDSQWDREVGVRADELEHLMLSLAPHLTEEDRAATVALFVPLEREAGAHADIEPMWNRPRS
jgi:GH24 family phage-related lysozyme (muramidase)